jgi:hypothetical protein
MGTTVSTIHTELKNSIAQKIQNRGPNQICIQDDKGTIITGINGSTVSNINKTQKCAISAEVVYDVIVESTSELIRKLNSETKGGIGIVVSNTDESIVNFIQNNIENDCGNFKSIQTMGPLQISDIENGTITNVNILQDSSSQVKCNIEASLMGIAKTLAESKIKTVGPSLGDLLFGSTLNTILTVVVITAVVGVLGKFAYGYYKKNKEEKENKEMEKVGGALWNSLY